MTDTPQDPTPTPPETKRGWNVQLSGLLGIVIGIFNAVKGPGPEEKK